MTPFAYSQPKTIGQVVRLDPSLDDLLDKDAQIEVLADGFQWSEGPVWIKKGVMPSPSFHLKMVLALTSEKIR